MQLPLFSPHHASLLTKITLFIFFHQSFVQKLVHMIFGKLQHSCFWRAMGCNDENYICQCERAFSCPEVTQRLCELADYYICWSWSNIYWVICPWGEKQFSWVSSICTQFSWLWIGKVQKKDCCLKSVSLMRISNSFVFVKVLTDKESAYRDTLSKSWVVKIILVFK